MNRAVRGTTLISTPTMIFRRSPATLCEGLAQSTVEVISYEVLDNHFHFVMTCASCRRSVGLDARGSREHMPTIGPALIARAAAATFIRDASRPYLSRQVTRCFVCVVTLNAMRCGRTLSVARSNGLGEASTHAAMIATRYRLLSGRIPPPPNWIELVNTPQTAEELADLRRCINRDQPIGDPDWVKAVAPFMGLTLRPRGRPKRSPAPLP